MQEAQPPTHRQAAAAKLVGQPVIAQHPAIGIEGTDRHGQYVEQPFVEAQRALGQFWAAWRLGIGNQHGRRSTWVMSDWCERQCTGQPRTRSRPPRTPLRTLQICRAAMQQTVLMHANLHSRIKDT